MGGPTPKHSQEDGARQGVQLGGCLTESAYRSDKAEIQNKKKKDERREGEKEGALPYRKHFNLNLEHQGVC